jgi:hypothetical protein
MKIIPSEKLAAHLAEQNVPKQDGYEVFDSDYMITKAQLRYAHPTDSPDELKDRVDYFLIWKHFGVQANDGTRGAELQNAQKVGVLTEEFKKMNVSHGEHLPAIRDEVRLSSDSLCAALHGLSVDLRESQAKEAGNLKDAIEQSETTRSNIAVAFADAFDFTFGRILKGFYLVVGLLACIFLALVVLSAFAYKAHAQTGLDGVRVSAATVTKKQWMGGIAKIDFGSGLVVDCVSTPGTCLITATGVAPGSGITTLNGLTTDPQIFAKADDTNMTLAISSLGSTHTFTLAWAGSLSAARGGTGSAANTGAAGKVLIGNGAGAFIEGDPLVQGVVAAGASLAAIAPVYIGGVDGSGNSKGLVVDASGRPTVNVNGTVPVSGTFWQTTQPVSGTFWQTTQPVSIATAPVLVAGSAIIGKVGIDQTTPGTTNGVQVNAALPAGTNVIGHVIADTGSTTAVTGNVATTAADGSSVTLGSKADAKSTATDTTAVTIMQVLKEISAMVQAPASTPVTNAGTFAAQADITKVAGAAISQGHGTAATAIRVELPTDGTGVVIANNATAANLKMQTDSSGATGAAPPSRAELNGFIGSGATGGFMAGAAVGDTYKNINVSTATTTLLVTGVSGRQVRISACT